MAHIADARAGVVGVVVAKNLDLAASWPQKPGENPQKSRLAGAVFADQDIASAGFEVDGDLAQRGKRAKKLRNVFEVGAKGRAGGLRGLRCHGISSWRFQRGRCPVGEPASRCARVGRGRSRLCGAAPGWPFGVAGAYLLAHLACNAVAWKTPSRPIGALSDALRIVLEGVRRRLGALVDHGKSAAGRSLGRVALKLIQNKGDVGPVLLDRARFNEAFHAQIALVCLVAHPAEFGDGDVVALAGAEPENASQPMVPTIMATAMPIRTELEDFFIARFLRYGDRGVGSMVRANMCDMNHIFTRHFRPFQ